MPDPYQPPAVTQAPTSKIDDPSRITLARWAWWSPLAALVGSMAINCVGIQTPEARAPLGIIIGFLYLIGFVAGAVFTVIAFVNARRYQRVLRHAIGGLIALLATIGLFAMSFIVLSRVQERAEHMKTEQHLRQDQEPR